MIVGRRRSFLSPSIIAAAPFSLVDTALATLDKFYAPEQDEQPRNECESGRAAPEECDRPKLLEVPRVQARLLRESTTDDAASSSSSRPRFISFREECERLPLREAIERLERPGVRAGSDTYALLLRRCGNSGALLEGKRVHAHICSSKLECDRLIGKHLVEMYGKCREVNLSMTVLDAMQDRNAYRHRSKCPEQASTSGTSSLQEDAARRHSTHVQHHYSSRGQLEKFTRGTVAPRVDVPERAANGRVRGKCASRHVQSLRAFAQGEKLLARISATGLEMDMVLETGVLNMYGKCGRLEEASKLFNRMAKRNFVTWSAMIDAFAQNGECGKAVDLFWRMEQEGERASGVTFVSVFNACSHSGLMEQARYYFTSIQRERGLELWPEHFGCVVDLLGRAGWLSEAEELIAKLPCKSDAVLWMILLGACKIHGDMERGERAAEKVFELDPSLGGPYVLLANIYAAAGRWDLAAKLRKRMEENRLVKKLKGKSWVEAADGKLHEFVVGDRSHPQMDAIVGELRRLKELTIEAGYAPEAKVAIQEAEEGEDESILFYHSEKLAIALGLLVSPAGTPVRIVKNLRVCPCCHAQAKFISRIAKRQIVIRDAKRFHYF